MVLTRIDATADGSAGKIPISDRMMHKSLIGGNVQLPITCTFKKIIFPPLEAAIVINNFSVFTVESSVRGRYSFVVPHFQIFRVLG